MNVPLIISYWLFVLFGSFVIYLFLLWMIALCLRITRSVRTVTDRTEDITC